MKLASLNLGAWHYANALAVLAAVLLLGILNVTVLAGILSPSAVAAGSCGALMASYLNQSGNSFFSGGWRVRLALTIAWLLTMIIAGSLGTLAFGQ